MQHASRLCACSQPASELHFPQPQKKRDKARFFHCCSEVQSTIKRMSDSNWPSVVQNMPPSIPLTAR